MLPLSHPRNCLSLPSNAASVSRALSFAPSSTTSALGRYSPISSIACRSTTSIPWYSLWNPVSPSCAPRSVKARVLCASREPSGTRCGHCVTRLSGWTYSCSSSYSWPIVDSPAPPGGGGRGGENRSERRGAARSGSIIIGGCTGRRSSARRTDKLGAVEDPLEAVGERVAVVPAVVAPARGAPAPARRAQPRRRRQEVEAPSSCLCGQAAELWMGCRRAPQRAPLERVPDDVRVQRLVHHPPPGVVPAPTQRQRRVPVVCEERARQRQHTEGRHGPRRRCRPADGARAAALARRVGPLGASARQRQRRHRGPGPFLPPPAPQPLSLQPRAFQRHGAKVHRVLRRLPVVRPSKLPRVPRVPLGRPQPPGEPRPEVVHPRAIRERVQVRWEEPWERRAVRPALPRGGEGAKGFGNAKASGAGAFAAWAQGEMAAAAEWGGPAGREPLRRRGRSSPAGASSGSPGEARSGACACSPAPADQGLSRDCCREMCACGASPGSASSCSRRLQRARCEARTHRELDRNRPEEGAVGAELNLQRVPCARGGSQRAAERSSLRWFGFARWPCQGRRWMSGAALRAACSCPAGVCPCRALRPLSRALLHREVDGHLHERLRWPREAASAPKLGLVRVYACQRSSASVSRAAIWLRTRDNALQHWRCSPPLPASSSPCA